MIKIHIDKKTYKGIYSWQDMTLQKFTELASIPMPEGYESFILADGKFGVDNIDHYIEAVSHITDEQVNGDFPQYYRKVIECLTNIPYKKIQLMDRDDMSFMYECYFKPFVVSLLYHAPVINFMGQIKEYEPDQIGSFRIGLRRFYLPESVTIMDQVIPLAKEPAITYTEASDIFRGMKVSKDDVKRLALFMAIYCRKKGEEYSEERTVKRESLFMKAPMSVVWSVFFYTARRLSDSTMIILLFGRLPKQIREVKEKVTTYQSLVTEVLSSRQAAGMSQN